MLSFLVLVATGVGVILRRIAVLIAKVRAERTRRTLALPPIAAPARADIELHPPDLADLWIRRSIGRDDDQIAAPRRLP